jgi:radical SAM protein with 4Fe4S-binding SPASM domain
LQIYSIQIENTAYCNRKCPWCPQSKLDFGPDDRMDWKTLEKVVKDLVEMNYQGRIHPYGNGEPLTDSDFIKRVRYIKNRLPKSHMYIATNGDYVGNAFSFDDMFMSGINEIQVNYYDDNNKHLKYYISSNGNQIYHYNVGDLRETFYNRAGNIKITNIITYESCWWPGRKLFINYQGDMLVCCSDWKYEDVVGNVHELPINELANSPKIKMYQDKLADNKSHELPLCSQCNLIRHQEAI